MRTIVNWLNTLTFDNHMQSHEKMERNASKVTIPYDLRNKLN